MADRDAVSTLETERRAAEALRETLAKMPGIDDETVRDTIEGETGLHEAIADVVATLTDAETMSAGLAVMIEKFEARKARYEARTDFLRSAIEQAMVIGELRKLELPDCTLSLSQRPRQVVIIDEAKLPARFWKQPEPVIDKRALAEALKSTAENVPGAVLSNGAVSLTIRRA